MMAIVERLRAMSLIELFRYYQAALVNTAFGFGVYALLVWLGVNPFVAQILAHLLGIAFNYVTYSRHVFRNAAPAKMRFVAAYGVNYLVNLAFLWAFSRFIPSPYLAGLLATLAASVVNYFALKRVVFAGPGQAR